MTTIKRQTAEALFPLLSAFHDVNGLTLKAVSSRSSEESPASIVLDFGQKCLVVRANGKDDTVEFWSTDSPFSEGVPKNDTSNMLPWRGFIGREFGWGWVTVNQQGYLDGIVLSFGGITPQLLITVVASSLKVAEIGIPAQSVATG
jgi:Family of unknown function (DUF6334)